MRAELDKLEQVSHQLARTLGDDDAVRLSDPLKPRGKVRRVADEIEILPTPIQVSDLARLSSVAQKKQRLTSSTPCASVRAIQMLTSG